MTAKTYWNSLTNVVPYFVSHAFPDAPMSTNDSKYPVVIYTHGLADGLSEGGTAAEACRTNDQIKAAVLLDAYLDPLPNLLKLGLQKPFLAMNSPSSGLAGSNLTLFNRATNNAYILQILKSQHETFTDQAWITQHTSAARQAGQTKTACLISFFNKHFKDQDDHLLDVPTNTYANIISFRRKP